MELLVTRQALDMIECGVLLVLPPGYGQGVMPSVHVLEPALRTGAPHRYLDGSLCLDHSGASSTSSVKPG